MTYPTILPRSARVLEEVSHERARQDARWGQQNHPDGTHPDDKVSLKGTRAEIRDLVRDHCDWAHAAGAGTWADILTEEWAEALAEEDREKLRTELIQTAAVCVAWVEAIDRRAE